MTDNVPTVAVRGTAAAWAPADHAELTFTISRRGATSASAVAAASEAYQLLDRALVAAGDVVARRRTVALTVRPITRWDPETNREVREGFDASRAETVRFAPPAASADALRKIALAVPDLGLLGPDYGLDPDNAVHARVRADATAAARASAVAYADGLGLVLGELRRLAEPGVAAAGGSGADAVLARGEFGVAKASDLGASGGEGPVVVDLSDQDVEVVAVIEATFALVTPD